MKNERAFGPESQKSKCENCDESEGKFLITVSDIDSILLDRVLLCQNCAIGISVSDRGVIETD